MHPRDIIVSNLLVGVFCFIILDCSYAQSSGFKKLSENDYKSEIVNARDQQQKAEARTRLFFHFTELSAEHASGHLKKGDMLWSELTPLQRISWEEAYQGVAFYLIGDLDAAEAQLRKSASSSLSNKEWLSLGFSYHQIANVFRDRGRYDSARANYSRAAEQYRKYTLSFFWIKLRTDRALMFLRRSDLSRAQSDIRNVFTLSQKFNDRELNAQAYRLLGEYHRHAMNFSEANQMLTRAFANTDSSSATYWYAIQSRAELSLRTGDFESARRDLQELILKQRKFPNQYDRANLLLKTAEGYIDKGYYAVAVNYLNKCKDLTSKSGYNNLSALVDLNDSWMAYWLNNPALSLERLSISENSFLDSGDSLNYSNCLNVRGMNLVKMKKYDSALIYYSAGYKIRDDIGDVPLISASVYHIGELYNLIGEYDRALSFLWRGLKMDQSLEDGYGVSMYGFQLAYANHKKGYLDSANYYLKISIKTGVEHKSFESLQKSYLLLSEIQEQTGNKQESLESLKKYITVSDSISARNSVQSFAAYQTMFDLEEQKRQVEILNKDRMLLDEQARNQRILVYVLLAGLFLSFGFWFFYYRFGKRMANLNVSLKDRAEEINQKNKELESALANLSRAQDQLVKSEKMASVGVLASGIAHELNNPLNFIHGGLQQLEQQIGKPEKNPGDLATFVEIMKEGLTRATTILKGLGHYSRQSDKMDERCDIHKIIDNCLLILNNSLKYRIEIQKQFSAQEFILIGNEGRLHQALLNILSNAEQAIVGHGTISIKTRISGPVKTIEISDTGYGISKDNLSKLGSLFFTTKEPGKGTGFGLSISYKVIQEHGGTIEVESEVGVGTKFYLIFGGTN